MSKNTSYRITLLFSVTHLSRSILLFKCYVPILRHRLFFYLFVCCIGHLMSTPISRRIDIFFCLVGCAMFVASGAFTIQYFENMRSGETRNTGLAKAAMAIINGALFLLDSLLTWRGEY